MRKLACFILLIIPFFSANILAQEIMRGRDISITDSNESPLLPKSEIKDSFTIALYCPPTALFIDTQEKCDSEYKRIADAGFTYIWGEYPGTTEVEEKVNRILNSCKKYHIQYGMHLPYGTNSKYPYFDREKIAAFVNKWKDHPAIPSFTFDDEISRSDYMQFGALRHFVDSILEPTGKFCFNNIGMTDSQTPEISREVYDAYMGKIVKAKILSLTCYPLAPVGLQSPCLGASRIRNSYWSYAVARKTADIYGTTLWTATQSIGLRYGMNGYNGGLLSSIRIPTEADSKWVFYSDMVFGFMGASYFAYWRVEDPDFISWMIDRDGSATQYYDRAKRNNPEFRTLGDMLTAFKHKGIISHNDIYAQHILVPDSAICKDFSPVTNIESNGSLTIGCYSREGTRAAFVLNEDLISGNLAEVNFQLAKSVRYEVWNGAGLEQKKNENRVTFRLEPGEAKFIIFEGNFTGIDYSEISATELFTVLKQNNATRLKFADQAEKKISLYTAAGELINTQTTSDIYHDVTPPTKGVYIIHVLSGNKSLSKQIIE